MQEKFAFVRANVKHFNFSIEFVVCQYDKINPILSPLCNAKV